jgi:hypothetical protein
MAVLKRLTQIPESMSGCETCDYGSCYTNKFYVQLTSGELKCEVNQMYEYVFSEDYLMKLFIQNVETIKQFKEKEFIDWLEKRLTADTKEKSWLNDTEVECTFYPKKGLLKW